MYLGIELRTSGVKAALQELIFHKNLNPQPVSGHQEKLENLVNRFIYPA